MVEHLKPCPFWPNCVSSRADAWRLHRIEPFAISGDPAAALARLKALLEETPRTEIVAATDDYLHAACRTRLGFVDDLECQLASAKGVIHVRSVSRAYLCRHRLGREQAARRGAAPAVSERVTGRRYGRPFHTSGGGKVTVARRPPSGLSSSANLARCKVATPATRLSRGLCRRRCGLHPGGRSAAARAPAPPAGCPAPNPPP